MTVLRGRRSECAALDGDSLLAPRAMGQFVIRLADKFELENPHTVGPDIGTGALLFERP